jgi:hypothetical protein
LAVSGISAPGPATWDQFYDFWNIFQKNWHFFPLKMPFCSKNASNMVF